MRLLEELIRVCDSDERKSIYAAIVGVVHADEVVRPQEEVFLDKMRRSLEIQEEDGKRLFRKAQDKTLRVSIPSKPVPQVLVFAYAMEAAAVDGQIDSTERKFVQKLASVLQIDADRANELLEILVACPPAAPTVAPTTAAETQQGLPRSGEELGDVISLSGLDSRVIDENDVYSDVAWKVDLTNKTSERVHVEQLIVEFLDHDGFALETDYQFDIDIPPQKTHKARGNSLLDPVVAVCMASMSATVLR